MSKIVNYLYPYKRNPNSLKVFQDPTSQIKAIYFTREYMKDVEKLKSSKNYSVYFLFNTTPGEEEVYIGQSKNGVERIQNHGTNKNFWTFCMMFVTDNNDLFDASKIDYLEYYFIRKFVANNYYKINNKELRQKEPNINMYDMFSIRSFISQIEFFLKSEKINIDQSSKPEIAKNVNKSTETKQKTYYYPKNKFDENTKIYVEKDKFIIEVGSEINRPIASSINWSDGGVFNSNYNKRINNLLEKNKVIESEGKLIVVKPIALNSPSTAGCLITGRSTNGWDYFEGISEIRSK